MIIIEISRASHGLATSYFFKTKPRGIWNLWTHEHCSLSLSNRESISRLKLSILQLWNSFPSLVSFHFIISFIRRCNTVSLQSHCSVMFTSINLLSSPGTLISEFGLEESEPFILCSVRGGCNGVFLFWLKFPFWFFHYLYWINSLYGIWENLDFGFFIL